MMRWQEAGQEAFWCAFPRTTTTTVITSYTAAMIPLGNWKGDQSIKLTEWGSFSLLPTTSTVITLYSALWNYVEYVEV